MNRLESLTRHRTARKLESSASLQSQLNAVKNAESEAKEKLEQLHKKKALMPESVHLNRQMDDLINSIKLTKAEIEDFPYRLDVLRLRLKASQERENLKKRVLKSYRKSQPASDLKKKSNLLLRHLRLAEKTNQELLAMHKKRQQTEEATGQRINPGDVSGGFFSLKVLLEFCEQENAGNGRKFIKWESIPFQKI